MAMPPAGTTTRFIMLITLVMAGGLFTFYELYFLVPGNWDHFISVFSRCFADPRISVPDPDDFERARRLLAVCQAPAFYDKVAWIGWGFLLLTAVAALLYGMHPVWIRRRGGLRPYVRDEDNAEVLGYLDALRSRMGLARAPAWFVAPRSIRTGGGQAFGLPWRRCVRLDAGLIMLYTRDRALFRTVVLHELAHLRNRDVDKTYLTIAIWWSFVAVVAVPLLGLVGYAALPGPTVTRDAMWSELVPYMVDRPHNVGQALVVAVLVYLVRNAILRVRELHADAVGTAYDEPVPAADPGPPDPGPPGRGAAVRWSWPRFGLGTHPAPEWRAAVRRRPELLWRPTLWELAGVGVVAGLLGNSLDLLVRGLFLDAFGKLNTFGGEAAVGAVLGPPLTAFLVVSLWRAAAGDTGHRIRWWHCLVQPPVLALGVLAGLALPLLIHSFNTTPYALASSRVWWGDLGILVTAGVPLVLGGVLVAWWFRSATRGTPSAVHARWSMVAAATAVFPWFLAWYVSLAADGPSSGANPAIGCWLGGPVSGDPAGFFWTLGCAQAFPVLNLVELNPVTLPGLALLWLVPSIAALRGRAPGRGRASWRRAPLVGAAGGVIVIAAGVALPHWARAAVPEAVRHDLGAEGANFDLAYWRAYLMIAVLAQAAVALVTAGAARRDRPGLALLAASVTAVVATAGQIGSYTVARCVDLMETRPSRCLPEVVASRLAADLHTVTLYGLLAVIPAVPIGVLAGTLWRRRSRPPGPSAEGQADPRPPVPAGAVIGCLVVVTVTAAVLVIPIAWLNWARWGAG
ncbi:hypothetical protein [Streptosporangium sp. NPDC002721]|uniref:hypothetical protein n=1 Tax=Streptosporangium sp. NPDC002721 TaxID=3366188 RepID=UPI00367B0F08